MNLFWIVMSKSKNIICIIARTNSSRLKKKVLLKMDTFLMIEVLIKRMKLSKLADEIYLCTSKNENDRILVDIAKREGIKFVIGSELAVIERLINVIDIENPDNIIRVTGDNPLTDPYAIDKAIHSHIKAEADYTTLRFMPKGSSPEVIRSSAIKKLMKTMDPNESQYLSLYINDKKKFNCNILDASKRLKSPFLNFSVDTQKEFEEVNNLVCALGYKKRTEDYIEYAKNHSICETSPNLSVKISDSKKITYSDYINWQLGKLNIEEF